MPGRSLCGFNLAVVIEGNLIDALIFKGAGYSNILDANGNYVLKTIKTFEGDILLITRRRL